MICRTNPPCLPYALKNSLRWPSANTLFGVRLFFVLLVFLAAPAVFGRQLTLTEDPQQAAGPMLEELVGEYSLEEALASTEWRELRAAPNYGFTPKTIHLRLRVFARQSEHRVLHVDAWMKDLELTVIRGASRTVIDLGHNARFGDQSNRFRRILLPFHFEQGETTLVFRMQGEDTVRFPLQIWKPDAFQRFRDGSTALLSAYFGAMFIMIVYNLFVLISTREKSYLPYVLYVAAGLAYFGSQSGFVLQFTNLGPGFVRMHLSAAGIYIATLGAFTISFLQLRTTHRWIAAFLFGTTALGIAAAVLALIPGVAFSLAAKLESYTALGLLPVVMYAAVRRWRDGFAPARFFVLAFSLFVAGAILFLFGLLGILPFNLFTGQGIMVGSVVEVALLSLALSDRINFFKSSIERNLAALDAARAEILASEQNYRSLVEDSADMVFTLDHAGIITGANRAAFPLLGFRAIHLQGRAFSSLIHDAHGSAGLQTALFAESIKALDRGPSQFRMLLSSSMDEPVELLIRLEKIGTGADGFILGKAGRASDDSLLRFLNVERGEYSLDNYLANLELLNQRITRNLARFFSAGESVLLQTCLREILMNAVEHGNLGIDPASKRAAQARGRYVDFLVEALRDPAVRARRVRVRYTINEARAWFQVSDEGKGFDFEREMERARQGADVAGGRGLAMAQTFFDVVRFEDGGRRVSLIKFTGAGK